MLIIKVEYMVVGEAAKESLMACKIGERMSVKKNEVCCLVIVSIIYLINNQVYHATTKHIDMRFHKIKDLLAF